MRESRGNREQGNESVKGTEGLEGMSFVSQISGFLLIWGGGRLFMSRERRESDK